MQHVTAAYGEAVDHGDDRLGQGADLLLHVEHVEAGHAVVPHVAAAALDVHVAAAAEGLVARAGENHHAHVGHVAAQAQGVAHFGDRVRGEGVALVRSVDGDFCGAVPELEEDVLIFPNGGPLTFAHD